MTAVIDNITPAGTWAADPVHSTGPANYPSNMKFQDIGYNESLGN